MAQVADQHSKPRNGGRNAEEGQGVEGKWQTNIQTATHPFTCGLKNTIIPKRILNPEVDIESDRATMLIAKCINPANLCP